MSPELVAALGSAIVALISAGAAFAMKRTENKASPYDKLAERVVALEDRRVKDEARIEGLAARVTELEEDRTVLAVALQEQVDWRETGAAPPPPIVTQRARNLLLQLHAS